MFSHSNKKSCELPTGTARKQPCDLWTLCFLLAEIREAFRVLDRDGNGFISKQELGMAMRSLGYMPSEVELAIIMQRLDMDGETCLALPGCASPTTFTGPGIYTSLTLRALSRFTC